MRKAVFLDRDGVINFERGCYTKTVDDFIINQGIGESIHLLKEEGFLIIIVSNQGGIAKKEYSHSDVLKMHNKLSRYLKKSNTYVDDLYYCPHHNAVSNCLCRKPLTLLFEKAIAKYNIDISKSFMIGDADRDIIAAEKVGLKAFKIEANTNIFELCKKIIETKYV